MKRVFIVMLLVVAALMLATAHQIAGGHW